VLELVLVLVLMLMVVVEIHESLGEKMLGFRLVLMLHLMDDCVLIEGQWLMHRYYAPNQKELLFRLMMDLNLCLLVQNLVELVLLVLLMSSQMIELLFQFL
jgi:hypothetical protein